MKKLSILILTGILSLPVIAHNSTYAGIGILDSKINFYNTGINEYNNANIKIFYGIRLSYNIFGEIQYTNFGKSKLNYNNNTKAVNVKGGSLGSSIIYNINPESTISIFAKVGLHAWNLDGKKNNIEESDNGIDLSYGVGIDIKTTHAVVIRLDFERLNLEFDSLNSEMDSFSANILFEF